MSSPTQTSQTSFNPESPLKRVDPQSLEAIFSKDPESLTEAEVEIIVDALRKDRERFSAEPKARPKRSAAVPITRKVSAEPTLSIDDLEI